MLKRKAGCSGRCNVDQKEMPSSNVVNYIFQNKQDEFLNQNNDWGINQHSIATSYLCRFGIMTGTLILL